MPDDILTLELECNYIITIYYHATNGRIGSESFYRVALWQGTNENDLEHEDFDTLHLAILEVARLMDYHGIQDHALRRCYREGFL